MPTFWGPQQQDDNHDYNHLTSDALNFDIRVGALNLHLEHRRARGMVAMAGVGVPSPFLLASLLHLARLWIKGMRQDDSSRRRCCVLFHAAWTGNTSGQRLYPHRPCWLRLLAFVLDGPCCSVPHTVTPGCPPAGQSWRMFRCRYSQYSNRTLLRETSMKTLFTLGYKTASVSMYHACASDSVC